ncbi:MAG TPA: GntR family transcriptional regulator, partial [Steroidobacter sp.]|nr:GntR family transcriptional regulator [Steroidobacter sp.]
ERVTPSDIAGLRTEQSLESDTEGLPAGFIQYETLLATARSPVLKTFVRAVGQLGMSAVLRSTLGDAELNSVMRSVRLKRREQIESVIAGNVGAALAIEAAVLDSTTRLLESARASPGADNAAARLRALHLFSSTRRFKRPELLMQEIASDIVARGWPVGEHLGTEAELLERYRVSRSAFREAVRSLEQIGVVEMRTGRQSGLKTSSPSPHRVVSNCSRQFARMNVYRHSYDEAFAAIGVAAVGLAAQRHNDACDVQALARATPPAFFNAVAQACGNRIISLLVRILVDGYAGSLDRELVSEHERTAGFEALARAICSGDASAARRTFLTLRFGAPDAQTSLPKAPHIEEEVS